ncbi:hypothetical protein [Aestuariispira insulae]|uniref:Endoribonuclease XendoU n=1 Tax=Aestuariispira insulae TaxID=1461337 RepID=A0A3D9H8L2_9PROT|nr:hypothetical protein [Aestuariispira insulae]RED45834.1 endoribonuclease XendoU [Aestuariispira insulae]
MDDIFQEIWNADMAGNGVPALRPDEQKDEATGYVVVDERSTTVGTNHKVLAEVHIPEAKRPTYRLCQAVLDNYALERAATEVIRPEERQEEIDFVQAILPTPPIQRAKTYIEQSQNLSISDETLARMIHETWFKFGNAGNQRDATGFEHVFVGEQSSRPSKVGGYHYWHKYHLDDAGRRFDGVTGVDRIEYRGTQYGGAEQPGQGILVPEVVTLSLIWNAPAGDGGQGRTLEKPIGGFFVGLSPEGLMALGLVRARTQSGKIANINGSRYQLDLHRLDGEPNAIRTFFPRFIRSDTVIIDDLSHGNGEQDNNRSADNPDFKILAGMINPTNPEGGREFLQIANIGAQSNTLAGWRIVAPNGMRFELADIQLSAGDIYKFTLPTGQGVLRNRGGEILLQTPDGDIAQVASYTRDQSAAEGRPILFP